MLRSRSIVGSVALDQRVFRNSHRVADENNLGRIYREVVTKIPYHDSLKDIRKIIFSDSEGRSKGARAGQSFTFSRSLSFYDLKKLVLFFEKQLAKKSKFTLSSLKPIKKDKKHSKALVEKLNKNLEVQLFSLLESKFQGKSPARNSFFEITNGKFMEFYNCEKLVLKRGRAKVGEFESPYGIGVENVIEMIIENDSQKVNNDLADLRRLSAEESIAAFKANVISSYSIDCIDDERGGDRVVLSGKLSEFLTGELLHNGTPYFYLDTTWYRSSEDFLAGLNKEYESVFKTNEHVYGLKKWGTNRPDLPDKGENENSYLNLLAQDRLKDSLVLHKVTPGHMELCDVLKWTKDDIFVKHIKPSFDGDVRVLVHQIGHSCRLIEEDIRSGFKGKSNLKRYFEAAAEYDGDSEYLKLVKAQFKGWTFSKFKELFVKKRVNYVACIVDKSGRSISEIEKFQSNIAKMSMIEGFRTVRSFGSPDSRFLVSQIPLA
jgi:hypothetical protein